MTFPRLSFVARKIFASRFASEWAAVAVLIVVAVFWMASTGFELRLTWRDGSILFIAVGIVLTMNGLDFRRISLIAEYFALSLVVTAAFGVVSYLATAVSGPLVDRQLLAVDRALGFDWLGTFQWLQAHPFTSRLLLFAYNSFVFQGLFFGLLFGLLEKHRELREMFWLLFVAGLFTSAGALLFPALGPFKVFGLDSYGAFLADMERLRCGHHLSFALSSLTGVVSFPSFHTTLALSYTYGFRRTGAIGYAIAATNFVMLFAIPFAGGHYLTDMLGGAGVACASLCVVKAWPTLRSAWSAAETEMREGVVVD